MRLDVKSRQVTFIYIELFILHIVSKQLYSENKATKTVQKLYKRDIVQFK